MVTYINCKRCGKEIKKQGPREYCIKCRHLVDLDLQAVYREKQKMKRLNKLSQEEENEA